MTFISSFDFPENLGSALSLLDFINGVRLSGSSKYVSEDVVRVPVGTCVGISSFASDF